MGASLICLLLTFLKGACSLHRFRAEAGTEIVQHVLEAPLLVPFLIP